MAFKLTVPIDVSAIKDAKGSVKVAVVDASGRIQSQTVDVTKAKSATFTFEAAPKGARVIVGPATASDADLPKLRTLGTNVTAATLKGNAATTAPILINPADWEFWFRWCREFVIRGHVVCADGSPVPGAVVCAYDVNWFWWWLSKKQVGCAMTNISGAFEIKFTWCCGWLPWWWWIAREWEIDLSLAEKLIATLPPELRIKPIPLPDPAPDLALFDKIMPRTGVTSGAIATARPTPIDISKINTADVLTRSATSPIDLSRVENLRKPLLDKVSMVQLPIWPWLPWAPWNNCDPDIIFRVTQDCGLGKGAQVIVDEGIFNTRWNIPTTLNVTLTANDKACCIRKPSVPCKETECFVFTHACDVETQHIGGNVGAPAAPQGYVNPGAALTLDAGADRPFADAITISGTTECMTGVDYYEFEYAPIGGSYNPLPASSVGGFSRSFLDFTTNPFTWNTANFLPHAIGGHTVYETLQHYEANNPPSVGTWGSTRIWVTNIDVAGVWITSSAAWADGTYKLHVNGFKDAGGGNLKAVTLNSCDGSPKSEIILTLDNRPTLPDPFHLADHPCGLGTVHACTAQPDTNIVGVRIKHANGTVDNVLPCHLYQRQPGDSMEIDFYAYDHDGVAGHLGFLTMIATYDLNLESNLLVGTLSPLAGVPGIPAAVQAVSDYKAAVSAGAVAPTWAGGAMTLKLDAAQFTAAFPEPCCYQLELRAYKRTIVGCNGDFAHNNLTEYSFFVG